MLQLSDIIGHEQAVGYLTQTLTGDRRPHAYIFAGPTGVGRFTTAEALAATLLCARDADAGGLFAADAPPPDPTSWCGECDDCKMLAAGNHPDFHPVAKEMAAYHDDANVRARVMQELGIEVLRQFLLAPAAQAPARGRGKVFIIHEAELMSIPAQNALLKTLEEPAPGVTIILLCRRAELLLPTTLSRCALVRFGPLPLSFVHERCLAAGVAEPQATFWSTFTDGSLGQALDLAARELYPVKLELVEQLSQLTPGGDEALAEHLAKLADKLAEQAVAASRKADGSTLAKSLAVRQTTGTLLQMIASLYSDAMATRSGVDRPIANADQAECVNRVSEKYSPAQLATIIEQLSDFERMLWRNVSPKLVWDNVVVSCASAAAMNISL
jgi:DNA polymerase III subunit delta'